MVEATSLNASLVVRVTVDVLDELGLFDRSVDCESDVAAVSSLSLEVVVGDDSVVDFIERTLGSVEKKFSWCGEASLIIVVSSTEAIDDRIANFTSVVEVASLDALILDRVTVDVSVEVDLVSRSVDWKSIVTVKLSLSLEAGVGDGSVENIFSWFDEASLNAVVSST